MSNHNNKKRPSAIARKQRGIVLITGLIMLLIMTLIGTVSMQGSTFNEKMSSNDVSHTMAFQAAESAVETALSDRTNLSGALGGSNVSVSVDLQETTVTSSAEVEFLGDGPAPGYALGDEDSFVTYSFEIGGTGEVPVVNARIVTAHGINVIAPDNL